MDNDHRAEFVCASVIVFISFAELGASSHFNRIPIFCIYWKRQLYRIFIVGNCIAFLLYLAYWSVFDVFVAWFLFGFSSFCYKREAILIRLYLKAALLDQFCMQIICLFLLLVICISNSFESGFTFSLCGKDQGSKCGYYAPLCLLGTHLFIGVHHGPLQILNTHDLPIHNSTLQQIHWSGNSKSPLACLCLSISNGFTEHLGFSNSSISLETKQSLDA